MGKILVSIYVPAIERSFDVFLPPNSSMHDVLLLVSKALTELSGDSFKATATSVLCDAENGLIFNINASVWELGLKNGSRLMLI